MKKPALAIAAWLIVLPVHAKGISHWKPSAKLESTLHQFCHEYAVDETAHAHGMKDGAHFQYAEFVNKHKEWWPYSDALEKACLAGGETGAEEMQYEPNQKEQTK